jgi:RHS repeat-associated protein
MVALAEPKTWPNKTEKASSPRLSHPRKSESAYPRFSHATSGLRFYFPETGRWLSHDPLGEEAALHLYAFLRNDPIERYDKLGLLACSVSIELNVPPAKMHLLLSGKRARAQVEAVEGGTGS